MKLTKVIILRGNSGSGKTTVAKELHKILGSGNLLISQDVVRREMLREKDTPKNLTIGLIKKMIQYGLDHCEYIIIEGILAKKRYGEMIKTSILPAEAVYAYYYDLPLEETLRRHKTKRGIAFEESRLIGWFHPHDYLGVEKEQIITKEVSVEEMLVRIVNDLGLEQ